MVSLPGDERVPVRVTNGVEGEVNIQLRPANLIGEGAFHVQDGGHARVSKPGELVEGEEQLLRAHEEPESAGSDVGYLNLRSADAKRF